MDYTNITDDVVNYTSLQTDGSLDKGINGTEEEPDWFVYYGIPYNPEMKIYGIFILVVASLGILGNFFTMAVLSQKNMSSIGTTLLFHLAIPDNVYLVAITILDGIMWLNPGTDFIDHIAIVSQSILGPISHTAYTTGIYITAALALQRYAMVAKPLQVKSMMTRKIIRWIVLAIYIFSILFNIPHWIAMAPERYWEPYLNKTWLRPRNKEFMFSNFYTKFYRGYVNMVIKLVVPIVIFITTTSLILVHLYRSRHGILKSGVRSAAKSINTLGGRNENKLTLVVLAVTLMSILSHSCTSLQFIFKQSIWQRGKLFQSKKKLFSQASRYPSLY
ncbi:G-protein coupled receptor daf-37-like [Haliotis rufescens]|uniref:G-protein coupled receptor daf-37-like n=1 Tax=Haliotis rufescens TaxID=6454 RepID=UPI00201F4112|nr:G-protein coupled receptor daf-37-like [Haliotis rufescens]